jgi:hypothetical protein
VGRSFRYHHLMPPDAAAIAHSAISELVNRERTLPPSGD